MHLVWQSCKSDIFLVLVLKTETTVEVRTKRHTSSCGSDIIRICKSFFHKSTVINSNSSPSSTKNFIQSHQLQFTGHMTNVSAQNPLSASKPDLQTLILLIISALPALTPTCYLVAVVRVQWTPGAPGSGGSGGGWQVKLHTLALCQAGLWTRLWLCATLHGKM